MRSRIVPVFAERAGRPVVMGRRWAIASGHPVATWAGARMLERGGRAIDAALAIAAALNVVEPHMSGLGGDLAALVIDSRTGQAWAIDGIGLVPLEATPERFRDGIPEHGPLTVAVPAAARAWELLYTRWGTLPLREILAPAIELAADGFPVSHNLSAYLAAYTDRLTTDEWAARTFVPAGRPPQPGDILRQPHLARTFEILATAGFAELYRGRLAEQLVRSLRQAGGVLSTESLALAEAKPEPPLQLGYREWTVWAPPSSIGAQELLLTLALLDRFPVAGWKPLSAELLHVMIEATKLAEVERERWTANSHAPTPLPAEALDPAHAQALARTIDLRRSTPRHAAERRERTATTAFVVVDSTRLAIVGTASLHEPFGSGFVAGDTGILLNNALVSRTLDPQAPYRLAPGSRVRHALSPIAVTGNRTLIGIGSSGGDAQPHVLVHVLTHLLEFGFSAQEAVELPRWRFRRSGRAAVSSRGADGLVEVEGRLPNATIEGLQARGHRVERLPRWGPIGSCQLVLRRGDRDIALEAAADPRSDAYALAW
ncbi:gamma-glutamyltransferase [Thermomicrobium sp. 4228-Ro]|uniref:gamma-glutamyltransferase family protein n=1 Tax=Thermomicrobium sp. 4228-Ro TaxID=2993937 RepID=UPI002248DA48|nr:gamma-glutamyltransferase [Thermomicrobium sp. 4228-Ro]MCX2726501.1 gamma-glutamyltransferase [Thermomicrobium sp. 4228-Ro]